MIKEFPRLTPFLVSASNRREDWGRKQSVKLFPDGSVGERATTLFGLDSDKPLLEVAADEADEAEEKEEKEEEEEVPAMEEALEEEIAEDTA